MIPLISTKGDTKGLVFLQKQTPLSFYAESNIPDLFQALFLKCIPNGSLCRQRLGIGRHPVHSYLSAAADSALAISFFIVEKHQTAYRSTRFDAFLPHLTELYRKGPQDHDILGPF